MDFSEGDTFRPFDSIGSCDPVGKNSFKHNNVPCSRRNSHGKFNILISLVGRRQSPFILKFEIISRFFVIRRKKETNKAYIEYEGYGR